MRPRSTPNPHAQALGRLGGLAKSAKKTRAARANGKLGAGIKKTRQKPNV